MSQTTVTLETNVVTDASNKIVWVDAADNYRVRPDTELFLEVMRSKVAASGTPKMA